MQMNALLGNREIKRLKYVKYFGQQQFTIIEYENSKIKKDIRRESGKQEISTDNF